MQVKTRFAPSPTGSLHIGSIRTALYAWLFARHYHGKFILRIEDTDSLRSKSISVASILRGLKWLGIDWDEGPYFQTKRLERYKEVIQTMLEQGSAYKCFCSPQKIEKERIEQISRGEKPRYSRTCRELKQQKSISENYVVRFKNPLFGQVTFKDKIRGKITFNNKELDDLVIQRSNKIPTYNFCVVIDDLDMGITHVIRGEDHINNTPRQINILQSLRAKIPVYAHVSMIFDENGKKFSKRNHAMDVMKYYEEGFLPEALLNYIVRLGWSFGNQEIFNISEMQELFTLDSISKSSSIFNMQKLLWLNRYYLHHLPTKYISKIFENYMNRININIKNGPDLKYLLELFKGRYHTLQELAQSCKYFYEDFESFDKIAADKYLTKNNYDILKNIYKKVKKISIWKIEELSLIMNSLLIEFNIKIKDINMLLRVVLTGNMYSPNISSVMFLVGKKKILLRLKKAIYFIENENSNENFSKNEILSI